MLLLERLAAQVRVVNPRSKMARSLRPLDNIPQQKIIYLEGRSMLMPSTLFMVMGTPAKESQFRNGSASGRKNGSVSLLKTIVMVRFIISISFFRASS